MARIETAGIGEDTEVRFVDPIFAMIEGTARNGRLNGTAAAEVLDAGGGRLDVLRGGAGADVFVFSDTHGMRDGMRVLDFDANEDALFLGDAQVAFVRAIGPLVRLRLEDDRDAITLRGMDDPGDVRLLTQAEFDALALMDAIA